MPSYYRIFNNLFLRHCLLLTPAEEFWKGRISALKLFWKVILVNDYKKASEDLVSAESVVDLIEVLTGNPFVPSLLAHPKEGEGWRDFFKRKFYLLREKEKSVEVPPAPRVTEEVEITKEQKVVEANEEKITPIPIVKQAIEDRQECQKRWQEAYNSLLDELERRGLRMRKSVKVRGEVISPIKEFTKEIAKGKITPAEALQQATEAGWTIARQPSPPNSGNATIGEIIEEKEKKK